MQKDANEFKELIFELMSGSLDLSRCPVKESEYVENEFSEGSFCEAMYEKVYHANCRLCERLGVEEDRDVYLHPITTAWSFVQTGTPGGL